MTRFRWPGVFLCVALTGVCASLARAQMVTIAPDIAVMPDRPNVAPAALGPTPASLSVAVRASAAQTSTTSAPAANRMPQRQSVALMIVGGAAILVGAVVEGKPGTVFMIGGAVIGLYGLYKYLE